MGEALRKLDFYLPVGNSPIKNMRALAGLPSPTVEPPCDFFHTFVSQSLNTFSPSSDPEAPNQKPPSVQPLRDPTPTSSFAQLPSISIPKLSLR